MMLNKRSRKLDFFCLSCLAAIGLVALLSCTRSGKGSEAKDQGAPASEQVASPEAEESQGNTAMKAPQIATDEAGLIDLQMCPKDYGSLSVSVSEDYTEAQVFSEGKLMQTISDPDGGLVATGDDTPVAYMDANFDGFVDIFIGPGESRTYSTLLLWNPVAQQFDRVGTLGDPAFQNIMLHPSGKSVYEGGSASWCANVFFHYVWEDNRMKEVEELTVVNDSEQYGEYDVESRYTLKDGDQNLILATDNVDKLPGVWKSVVEKYGTAD